MDNNRYYGSHGSGYGGSSSSNGNNDPGPIPERWLLCPRISEAFIVNKFLAFKTPLSVRFSTQMSPEHHFQPDMVFDFMKMDKVCAQQYPNKFAT